MKKTITDVILMYILIIMYTIPIINIYKSIKNPNIETLLINTLYIATLTTNIIIANQKTTNNKLTTTNIITTIILSLTILPLGLKTPTTNTIDEIVTYSIPTIYSLIIITYTLTNNQNLMNWLKKKKTQTNTTSTP